MEFSYEGPKKFELKKNILVSIYLLKKNSARMKLVKQKNVLKNLTSQKNLNKLLPQRNNFL